MKNKPAFLFFLSIVIIFTGCTGKTNKPVTLNPQPNPTQVNNTPETDPPVEGTNQQIKEENGSQNDDGTPAEIIENALDAYQEALAKLEKGDAETALEGLDEAYRLIVKLKPEPNSPLMEEKSELRLLIAKRIQEIYTTHITKTTNGGIAIPLVENKYVLQEIASFQNKEHDYFLEAYRRSGNYINMIREELRHEGLPEELAWIPIIESGFKVKAYSRARALGLWQFIASTGYRFGLKRDQWVDERMDPEKSTKAAVQYLKELHAFFGDWTTALASYNCGEFLVLRLIKNQRINYFDNFWDLFPMLPRETSRFVPRINAVLLIIKNPQKYGFELPQPDLPTTSEVITVNKPFKLADLAKTLDMPADQLEELNPELRYQTTPDREYQLKVPQGKGTLAMQTIPSLSDYKPPQASFIIHYVRRGETISQIARHYRTSITAIVQTNNLGRRYLIRPGQRLKIPASYRTSRYLNTTPATPAISIPAEGMILYTVAAGDTPYTIAQKFNMNLLDLLRINKLKSRSRIFPGQQLQVVAPSKNAPVENGNLIN